MHSSESRPDLKEVPPPPPPPPRPLGMASALKHDCASLCAAGGQPFFPPLDFSLSVITHPPLLALLFLLFFEIAQNCVSL